MDIAPHGLELGEATLEDSGTETLDSHLEVSIVALARCLIKEVHNIALDKNLPQPIATNFIRYHYRLNLHDPNRDRIFSDISNETDILIAFIVNNIDEMFEQCKDYIDSLASIKSSSDVIKSYLYHNPHVYRIIFSDNDESPANGTANDHMKKPVQQLLDKVKGRPDLAKACLKFLETEVTRPEYAKLSAELTETRIEKEREQKRQRQARWRAGARARAKSDELKM